MPLYPTSLFVNALASPAAKDVWLRRAGYAATRAGQSTGIMVAPLLAASAFVRETHTHSTLDRSPSLSARVLAASNPCSPCARLASRAWSPPKSLHRPRTAPPVAATCAAVQPHAPSPPPPAGATAAQPATLCFPTRLRLRSTLQHRLQPSGRCSTTSWAPASESRVLASSQVAKGVVCSRARYRRRRRPLVPGPPAAPTRVCRLSLLPAPPQVEPLHHQSGGRTEGGRPAEVHGAATRRQTRLLLAHHPQA